MSSPFDDYWTLTLTGTVQQFTRENIDKSGRNPRYNVSIHVAPVTLNRPDGDVVLPSVIPLRYKLRGADPYAGLEIGANVKVEASCYGSTPQVFHLRHLELLE